MPAVQRARSEGQFNALMPASSNVTAGRARQSSDCPGFWSFCGLLLTLCAACTDASQQHLDVMAGHDASAGCNGRGENLEAGLEIIRAPTADAGAQIELTLLEATPEPAIVGNNSWLFSLTLDGQPVEGLADSLTLIPFMPDHGHGTAIPVEVTEEAVGHYRFEPVHMRMAGFWEHTVAIQNLRIQAELVFGICLE